MEKEYMLDGLPARVEIVAGLVRIVNDPPLRRAVIGQPEAATKALVDGIKADYESEFGEDLAVSDESFVVEIWGHLYFDYILMKYRGLMSVILVFGLYDRFRRSCEVIDCGERGKDPNRWLWDKLVPFRKMLARWLGNVRLSRFTEG